VSHRTILLATLSLSGFVTSFGAHVVATNLPTYAETVGAGAFAIGLLIAVYDFAELFAKPAAGILADRRGMKPVLLIGLVVFIVGSLLFLIVSPKALLLVRFVQGLGAAALSTVSISLVARYFETDRGRAFGVYNAIKGSGYVIAPAAGGFLATRYGFTTIFIVSASIGLIALIVSVFLPSDPGGRLEDDEEPSLRASLRIFRDPRLMPIYAVIVINMFLVGILFGFLPVYVHGLGYSATRSGTVVSIATAAYLLIQPVAGALADRYAMRTTVLLGLLVAALCITAITFTSGWVLIGMVIAAGMGIGTVWTNSDALVGASASPSQMGASIGAAQSFKEFGDMVGPVLVGGLTQFFGVRVGFVTCGAVAVVLLIGLARSPAFSAR
jgi:MFS transporter, ACDE family, multidrug resistance protein